MPLIVNKQETVVKPEINREKATVRPKSKAKPVVEKAVVIVQQPEPPREILNRNFAIERKQVNGVASADTALVVNGKQKSIGRKSHYLLDMLTLDDE